MNENEDYWGNIDSKNDGKCFQQQVVFIHDGYGSQSGKPKTRRRRWTQKDMTNAFNAVKCTGMSLRGAASHYNVPESTLRDRVHGRVSLDCSRPGPPTFFTYEEEKKMVDHILFMSKIGYPYTRNQVVELAGDMTKAVDRIAPFKFLNPSQAWFYAFLNRWPDLKNYLYGPRSNRKSKGVSAESIQAYYDNLEKVLIKYDIKNKPDHIWMTDEVSIACDNSNVPKILPITIQRPQSNTYWNPTAAVLGAGNAAGDKIPAFLMFKASEISEEMMDGSVKGSKFATSSNGWVNADAFIQWYERHFRQSILQRPVILLYDGHLQFVTVRVLEKAKEDNVLLFPLPPHPPYNHCVESSCFAAYPKYFTKRIRKYHSDFKRNVNKTNVSRIICQAYEWALQPINLIQTFFKLGICPYNNLSSSLAPYMPNSSDDDQNDDFSENMDVNDSEFMQCNEATNNISQLNNHENILPLTHAHSPLADRSFSAHANHLLISTSVPPSNQNDYFVAHSLTMSPVYSNVSTIKVLDNMASKAMNQMHAQRSEATSNKIRTTLPICSSSAEIGIQAKLLTIKNTTRSIPIFPLNTPCSSNIIKIVTNDPVDKSLFMSQTSKINPIKLLKPSSNVVKTSVVSTFNRPILHIQSNVCSKLSNSGGTTKNSVIISKIENYKRFSDSNLSLTTDNNINNEVIKRISTSITTPVVIDNAQKPDLISELMELKPEIEDDQENGEIDQICNVCGGVEPPGLNQISDTDELIVDWAHCDFCYKWVHLQPCCDSRCVLADNRFKCIICIKQGTDENKMETDENC